MNFATLFERLDSTTKTSEKVTAITDYLHAADETEKLLTVAVLMGYKPKRPVKTTELRVWAAEITEIPLWLLEESYYVVGDLAETLALLLTADHASDVFKLRAILQDIMMMQTYSPAQQRRAIEAYWKKFGGTSLFLFNKLLTGNFRVGVSRKLVVRALSEYLAMEEAVVEHRVMGKWDPFEESFNTLFHQQLLEEKHFLPYPFFLAYPVDPVFFDGAAIEDWIVEPKLDGIRGQIIVRQGELFVWSRGEDLMTEKFVEFDELKTILPDGTVLDGEIIPWKNGRPLDFQLMQTRIGRKKISRRHLEDVPLVMVCYDILEWKSIDQRDRPLLERRELLEQVLQTYPVENRLKLSEIKTFDSWEAADLFRVEARQQQAEGLMLKRKDSPYEVGRKRGNWWKWKTDPMTVDGVLIYAQSGHGRRANLFTDYTFAVWDGGALVPFAKAYSGLTDKELLQIDQWIKRNTVEKFGPVRSVRPELVFELAFEGISLSSRHKSGIALRFPRILRWREDKPAAEANTKQDLLDLINARHESNS
ncbi:ATP-dependent DNA ligase [Sphingobacterium faecale]|uniref:DNA ligase (ATP) n=1 Tax=Sphingobacterium faecale TaxID=2803775 RepID=A0ABS1R2V8_9SPHI|nr:ATP-dependent DNA ligase [Sphingobacterium faecale]MBL1409037.1 ATP-dependent DNA ligase [Sphingobacterium faecale]